jgi:peptidoglycan/LPS O-acetylase OafA/YrhL
MLAFDLLRFVAAIMVVLYHFAFSSMRQGNTGMSAQTLTEWVKYGYLGVDAFFVISGFFIFMTAEGRSGPQFLIARFTRLYPALVICAVLTFAVTSILAAYSYRRLDAGDLIGSLTLVSFAPVIAPRLGLEFVDTTYWTLQAEFLFYGCVGVLIGLGIRRWNLVSVLLLIYGLSLPIPKGPLASLVGVRGYVAHFCLGGCLYLMTRTSVKPRHVALTLIALIGATVAVARTVGGHEAFEPAGFVAWTGVAIFLVSVAFMIAAALGRWSPRSKHLATLGGLSYPLYLIHHQIGMVVTTRLGVGDGITPVLLFTASAIFVAWLIHVGVERAGIRLLRRRLSPRKPPSSAP